jgi:hypothetical protein
MDEWGAALGRGAFYMESGIRVGVGVVVGWPEWSRLLGRLGHAMLGRAQRASRAN